MQIILTPRPDGFRATLKIKTMEYVLCQTGNQNTRVAIRKDICLLEKNNIVKCDKYIDLDLSRGGGSIVDFPSRKNVLLLNVSRGLGSAFLCKVLY